MKIAYWVVTVLAAALMTLASIPDILRSPEAVEFSGISDIPNTCCLSSASRNCSGSSQFFIPAFRD